MTIVNALKKLVTAWGGSTTADTIAEAIDDLSAVTPSSLPEVTGADNGDILKVVSGEWAKATPSTELPVVSATDNGDVLTVVEGAWAKAAPSGGGGGRDFVINLDPIGQTVSILEGTYAGLYAKLSQGVPVFGSVVSAGEGMTTYSSDVKSVEINTEESPATIWININVLGADVSLVWASDDTISIYHEG